MGLMTEQGPCLMKASESVSAAVAQAVSHLTSSAPLDQITPPVTTPSRWMANALGFFDPNYDDKTVHTAPAIEHAGKDTFFRDIHLFIDRATQLSATQSFKLVRDNLWLSLRGSAISWYTSEAQSRKPQSNKGQCTSFWPTLILQRLQISRKDCVEARREMQSMEYKYHSIHESSPPTRSQDHSLIQW